MGEKSSENKLRSKTCWVQGNKIFYKERLSTDKNFEEKTVVLVHGAGGSSQVWLNQLLRIQRYRILALDLPGHGRSEGHALSSIQEYSEFLGEFIQSLNLHHVILAGHSMGGGIALECALRRPKWLKGLILMDTGVRLRVKNETLEQLSQGLYPADIIPYLYSPSVDELVLNRAYAEMKRTPTDVYLADFQACNGFDRMEEIHDLAFAQNYNLPTLILCGEEDRMTPPKYSIFLHESLPKSEIKIISGAGHMIMNENPEEINRILNEYLILNQ